MLTSEDIEQLFPMSKGEIQIVSDYDEDYNCIAWSLNDSRRWWWPFERANPFIFWPLGSPREETIEAFLSMYESLFFVPCDGSHREEGYDKVALYALDDKPTHAARFCLSQETIKLVIERLSRQTTPPEPA